LALGDRRVGCRIGVDGKGSRKQEEQVLKGFHRSVMQNGLVNIGARDDSRRRTGCAPSHLLVIPIILTGYCLQADPRPRFGAIKCQTPVKRKRKDSKDTARCEKIFGHLVLRRPCPKQKAPFSSFIQLPWPYGVHCYLRSRNLRECECVL
jgi:hypothetical protein